MKDTGIGPGTTVRLKSSAARNLREKMSRWVVISASTQTCVAQDSEEDSVSTLRLEDLEIVKNGYSQDSESLKKDVEPEPEMYWGEDGFLHFAGVEDKEEDNYLPKNLRGR